MSRDSAPLVSVLETPVGPARVHVRRPHSALGTAVLGHGAGGGLGSVDLVSATEALLADGWAVALVEQPWRVAGRRVAGPPKILDAAWTAAVRALRGPGGALDAVRGPLLLGGRSAGARVACRTAGLLGADGVLCLSFPLHPPGRPDRLRAAELALVIGDGRAIAAIQGQNDPFGTPAELTAYLPQVFAVPGTHTIPPRSAPAVREAVGAFARPLRE